MSIHTTATSLACAPQHPVQCVSVQSFYQLSESELENSVILDLGQAQTYLRGHLPGAVHLPVSRIVRQIEYASGLLPDVVALQQLAQDFGLAQAKKVYVYDDEGGGWAGRMIWILDILNLSQVIYIDGGLRAWLAAGLPLDTYRNLPLAATKPREVQLNLWPNVDLQEMQALVESESIELLDARSLAEFEGRRQFSQRRGRIPGAVHYEWTQGMTPNSFSIRPLDIIRAELKAIGITGQRPIITYCQTHHRSGFTYLLCRLLGYSVRAYAGSWSEWGNNHDVPIQYEKDQNYVSQ